MTDGVKVACSTCRHWDTEPAKESGWGFCAMMTSKNGRAVRRETKALALDYVGTWYDIDLLGQIAGAATVQTFEAFYCAMWE